MAGTVQGDYDAAFAPVKDLLQKFIDAGEELGASITVNIDGRNVVDIWGGYRDTARTSPWTRDTVTTVWSTTKTVTNLAALMLVDRGQLDLFEKVATYWPEFAANGKQDIEVRQLLAHTSGVSGWEPNINLEELYDLKLSTERLAAQKPWWKPGTASGYHMQNQGHLVGELVRRVSGKSLKQFIAEEIAGPLGADFQLGAAECDWERVAEIVPPPPLDFDFSKLPSDSPAFKTFTGQPAKPETANTPMWRKAAIGALNGHSNSRGVNGVLSAITLGGEVNGVRLLSQKTIDLIFQEQASGPDLVFGIPLRWGIGYALPLKPMPFFLPENTERICFWVGWGGSIAIMDLERRMTITYVMNKMAAGAIGSNRGDAYAKAIYAAVASM
ncbi:beta-lactamase [Histoplasma capsulatum var. duboisii H88]|uniref:Beta-lactamase n=2 Tax=Ajellomyces capsulatus TaxID=5037 RepID=F0UIJ3_AJEC8|nr:beta-lactamase [Histoplasma capsulatum H143]EGC45598.1 beta-lactamase [Histoplasma capsulatum var. duboisii H88]QSS56251.1 lactone hydrolase [Histoplasma capsulatum var. duboisii H88]